MIVLIVAAILIFRWLKVSPMAATVLGISFGLIGLIILLLFSSRQGRMVHCLTWCPIGTIVNYARYINPFRMKIDRNTCTLCNACTRSCRYDALNSTDLESGAPGITCTLCGDCLQRCHSGSIQYRFFRLKPEAARNLYLFLTVSAHAVFLALARI